MRILSGLLTLCLVGSTSLVGQNSDPVKVAEYLKTLPATAPPIYDETRRGALATSSISCADHPQESPGNRNNFLWQYDKQPQMLEGFDKNRAFFGCADWHSAVASTWMLVSLLKQYPTINVASDIKDIVTTHFKKPNMDGEYNFFSEQRGPMANFEKPFGYTWLLKLYGEAKSWDSPDGKKLGTELAPLAKWMSERYVFALYDLKFPFRIGNESNTAWGMQLALDYTNLTDDSATLKTAIHDNAIRLFGKDKNCATSFEPTTGDMLSGCLTEAALMGRVMAQQEYLKWLDFFLPPVYSEAFQVYARDIDISHVNPDPTQAEVQMMIKSRLIGLNFQRAGELMTISYALPTNDPRVPVLRRLAVINATHGYGEIGSAGYQGQHWLSTYALLYENAAKGPAPVAPGKSKTPVTKEVAASND